MNASEADAELDPQEVVRFVRAQDKKAAGSKPDRPELVDDISEEEAWKRKLHAILTQKLSPAGRVTAQISILPAPDGLFYGVCTVWGGRLYLQNSPESRDLWKCPPEALSGPRARILAGGAERGWPGRVCGLLVASSSLVEGF